MADATVPVILGYEVNVIDDDNFLLMLSYAANKEDFLESKLTTFACAMERKAVLEFAEVLTARAKAPLIKAPE